MTSYVWRPFLALAGIIALLIGARYAAVPRDFGIGERGYMYAWHRKGNEGEWKSLQPKYKGPAYCAGCHSDKSALLAKSPHTVLSCEACHGPALDHPTAPIKLPINRSRAHCLRCHAKLDYPGSRRGKVKGIDPKTHYGDTECATCHNPHKPNLEGQP